MDISFENCDNSLDEAQSLQGFRMIRIVFGIAIVCLLCLQTIRSARELPDDRRQADTVQQNSQLFWKDVTKQFFSSYSNQNILSQWNIVRESVRTNVSDSCLNILTDLIADPLKEEWSAKSKFVI